jgi:hypothetical protein
MVRISHPKWLSLCKKLEDTEVAKYGIHTLFLWVVERNVILSERHYEKSSQNNGSVICFQR